MPSRLFSLVFLLLSSAFPLAVDARPDQPSPLTHRYPVEQLAARLLPTATWRWFPPASDRRSWEAWFATPLNRERRDVLVARAEALLGQPWPELPATLYMEFVRTGNRSNFEGRYFDRRERLGFLVLAECLEHRGRFLDEIANGLWLISEEATWCVPAHAARLPDDVLHRQDLESVDLFAAETAMTLSLAHFLLRDELQRLSPALCDRVRHEVLRRVVEPVETSDTFGRATWLDGHNNWSPWCSSNVLGSALLLLDDPARLARLSVRMMGVVDRFIDRYGPDGGCNEGPSYWFEAGGAMLVFLEMLHSRTDGFVDLYDQPKIAAMGRYIVSAHIAGRWFANFGDADAQIGGDPAKLFRYGQRIGDAAMQDLGLLALRDGRRDGPVAPLVRSHRAAGPVLGLLMDFFWVPTDRPPGESGEALETWLPDLQVLFAREKPQAGEGLYLAIKGGHNGESHNHNDCGHFIVALDGQPVVIDLGRETYTRQVFSEQRYELLFTRGLGHNAPIVNGVEQPVGAQSTATDLVFTPRAAGPNLAMNLAAAYPPEAKVSTLRREASLDRGASPRVVVHDHVAAAPTDQLDVRVPLFLSRPVELLRPGLLAVACQPRRLLVAFDPAVLQVTIEPWPVKDPRLRTSWGDQLTRVEFRATTKQASVDYSLEFRAEEKR